MSDIKVIANYLESQGWLRQVAGDADFDAACRAIQLADDERKGLIISGPPGVGKTKLAEIVARIFAHHWRRGFRKIELSDYEDVEKLDPDWGERWCEDLHDEVILLDDIGAETASNDYGIITEPVATFITTRHNRYMRYVTSSLHIDLDDCPRAPFPMLFVTTNLNAAKTDNRYGARTLSRLKDFCVALHLTGPDKRKWTSVK